MEKKQIFDNSNILRNKILLLRYENYEVIYVQDSDLRISVNEINLETQYNKFDFFAKINSKIYGFNVENMSTFDEFYSALIWYSNQLNQIHFKIFKNLKDQFLH